MTPERHFNLKLLSAFLLLLILTFGCVPTAYSFHARVLSDQELDSISAGGFDIDINKVMAYRSAVAVQSNISAIAGFSLSEASIKASNRANITSVGNSAVAAQSNLAAAIALEGDIKGLQINNTNIADIVHTYLGDGGVEAGNLSAGSGPKSVSINNVSVEASAVAAQTNISFVVALNGSVEAATIKNTNIAKIDNLGNSALAAQTNISVVYAKHAIKDVDIKSINVASVTNTNTTDIGSANATNLTSTGSSLIGDVKIGGISVTAAAAANQTNITVIVSNAGDLSGIRVRERNSLKAFNF